MEQALQERTSGGGSVRRAPDSTWRMEIPAGPGGVYRWAQLDDYVRLPRGKFPYRTPFTLSLSARVSAADLPGTWGFGVWNDPFSLNFGVSGAARRLPALPDTAWFFYAGPPNYLAFRDTHPAQGPLMATFRAARIPSLLLAPGALAAPLLLVRPAARLLRRAARLLIKEDAALVPDDVTAWREYRLEWEAARTRFWVDGRLAFETSVSPRGPLSLVIWIDNQFAAFPPSGHLGFGTSPNPSPAWMEIKNIEIA